MEERSVSGTANREPGSEAVAVVREAGGGAGTRLVAVRVERRHRL